MICRQSKNYRRRYWETRKIELLYKEIEDDFEKYFNPIYRKSHFRVENIVTKDFLILIRRYSSLTR